MLLRAQITLPAHLGALGPVGLAFNNRFTFNIKLLKGQVKSGLVYSTQPKSETMRVTGTRQLGPALMTEVCDLL